jgi:tripartite-type tricarboxylate transporter receptor subunit TctC
MLSSTRTKTVRFIIPFPPGGPTDIMGRLAADILAKGTGQQFVPDNRGGAGGNIGAELCAKAPPDGYTMCMITAAQGVSPAIYRKMSYRPGEGSRHRHADGEPAQHAHRAPRAAGENA